MVLRFLSLFLLVVTASAATHNAATTSRQDVGAAYALCSSGDTLGIPAGTSVWTNTLYVTNAITIQGAGIGQTILSDNIGYENPVGAIGPIIMFTCPSNQLGRVTGIEFQAATSGGDVHAVLWLKGTCRRVRVDHCKFFNCRQPNIDVDGSVCGVIDHCSFIETNNHGIEFWNGLSWPTTLDPNADWGDGSWESPFGWGTTNMMVAEDCDFTRAGGNEGAAAIDTFAGGRFALRNCVFTNCYVEMHGTETTGRYRGGRACEVYGNKFYNSVATTLPFGVHLRSGSAVIWSNSFFGWVPGCYGAGLNSYRQIMMEVSPWGGANGTNAWDVSTNGVLYAGTHTGTNNAFVLIDSNAAWTVNQYVGYNFINTNRNCWGMASANTATSMTPENVVGGGLGSTNVVWQNGDGYNIRRVDAILDGCGRSNGTFIIDNFNPTPVPNDGNGMRQPLEPVYYWGNSMSGGGQNAVISSVYSTTTIREGYEMNNGISKPGYSALVYPHPLVSTNNTPLPPIILGIYGIGLQKIKSVTNN